MTWLHLPAFDCGQGIEFALDAEQLRHRRLRLQSQLLREVRHVTGAGDGPRAGREFTQNQPDQRGLAGPVVADEAGAADANHGIGGVKDVGPVGPGK